MASIHRKARVPYTAIQMLTLVNDIEAYPEFLNWCRGARILVDEGPVVEAELDIGIAGISKTMRTRNETVAQSSDDTSRIDIEMLDGPLKHLQGRWLFRDCEDGCDIELSLDYETRRTPFGALLRSLFNDIANSQLNAFIRRAEAVYRR